MEEKEIYENYLRMAPENFQELLGYIKEDILKEDTHSIKNRSDLKSNES